jgi:hypothetical protein
MSDKDRLPTMRITTLFVSSLLIATPAAAQDDPHAHSPGLYSVEQGEATAQFVVGDGAWGDIIATLGAIRGAEAEQNQAIIDQLWARRDINPPIFLFEVARRTVTSNPERSLEAYFLGRARVMYDAARCVDSSAMGIVDASTNFAGEDVVALMGDDGARLESVFSQVYESGALFTSQVSPWWACSYGDSAYFAAANNATISGAEWLKTEVQWAEIRQRISDNMLGNLELMQAGLAVQQN